MGKESWALLAATVLSVSLSLYTLNTISSFNKDITRLDRDIVTLSKEVDVKLNNVIYLLESRMNQVAATQDGYQIVSSRRIDIINTELDKLRSNMEK